MSTEKETLDELVAKYNEANDVLVNRIKELEDDAKSSKEDILNLKSELLDSQNEQLDKINEVLKNQGITIKNLAGERKEGKKVETLRDVLKAKSEELKSYTKKQNNWLEIKASGTMLTTNYSGGDYVQADRLEGFNDLPLTPINNVLQYVSRRSASSPIIEWVDKRNRDGAAGYTGEGLAKNQVDFDFVVERTNVEKITALIKVSQEMLKDVSYMDSAIRNELRTVVIDKLATEVLVGAGTSGTIEGVTVGATAWSAGDFANAVDNANTFDVLRTAITQITLEGYMPNVIMLNPVDYALMQMTKSTDAVYLDGQFLFMGVPVVQNAKLTADKFLVYDRSAIELYMHEDFNIQIGHDADDFSKNLVTMIGELRACTIMSTNKKKGIVYGTISTAKTALDEAGV